VRPPTPDMLSTTMILFNNSRYVIINIPNKSNTQKFSHSAHSGTGMFMHRYVHAQVRPCTITFMQRYVHAHVCSCTFMIMQMYDHANI